MTAEVASLVPVHTDVTVADLSVGDLIHLDGRARQVLSVTESDSPGYRVVRIEGYSLPFNLGAHWASTRVTYAPGAEVPQG